MKKHTIKGLLFSFLFMPVAALAVSGMDVKEKYVEVETKQGGEWFTARKVKTDEDSALRLKDVLPGKYKFVLDDDDQKSGQKLGLELRMLDEKGRRIKDDTDVDAYIFVSDTKVFIGTFETDDDGWLDLEGITPGTEYEIDVKDDGKVNSKDGLARIKVKTKIDGSDWFSSGYDRLDPDPTGQTNGVLEMENVISGKYKFKLKSGDPYDPAKPFVLKARMRKDNGKKIKEATKVKVYAYPMKIKTLVAEVMTDEKGWITLPEAQVGAKFRLKVKD